MDIEEKVVKEEEVAMEMLRGETMEDLDLGKR